MSRQLWDY